MNETELIIDAITNTDQHLVQVLGTMLCIWGFLVIAVTVSMTWIICSLVEKESKEMRELAIAHARDDRAYRRLMVAYLERTGVDPSRCGFDLDILKSMKVLLREGSTNIDDIVDMLDKMDGKQN